MAVTIEAPENIAPVTLKEYTDWVYRNVDIKDPESVQSSAHMLKALAANQRLFIDILNNDLTKLNNACQPMNTYTDGVIVLFDSTDQFGYNKNFAVRAVVWRDPAKRPGGVEHNNIINAYDLPHDHDFNFLTIGYSGPGYRTKIYEYEKSKVLGIPGESVDIQFLEDTFLTEGKIMFYRANVDIHEQFPPVETSISLNLLIGADDYQIDGRPKQQYCFDLERMCISTRERGPVAAAASIVDLAGELGNENTCDILWYIARLDRRPWIRASALKALARLLPLDLERIESAAASDPHLEVKQAVEFAPLNL